MAPAVLCLQETKLRAPTSFKLGSFLPRSLSANERIDAVGASGGILTAWDPSRWLLVSRHAGQFCLTTELRSRVDDLRFFITNVYGPCDAASREEFFDELRGLGALCHGPWLIAGDFNVARWPDDRSGGVFDANLAASFNTVVDELLLQELPLLDRRFTWSNMRDQPTMVRLDRAFINLAWASVLCNTTLASATRVTSDHVPLIVSASSRVPVSSVFRYEKGWALDTGFRSLVEHVWQRRCNQLQDPAARLARKLKWVRAESKKWARAKRKPDAVIVSCRAIIQLLDMLEEIRWLSAAESILRRLVKEHLARQLKIKSLYWRQRYSIRYCRLGDENTRFFHACASARMRKNSIRVLHENGVPAYSHQVKERILTDYYSSLMGSSRTTTFDFDVRAMYRPLPALADLERPFAEEEIRSALLTMRTDASPGPDGFSPGFFKTFWPLVKGDLSDLMAAFHSGTTKLQPINQAYMALLPKRDDVVTADGFRPISLQGTALKILCKVLTRRIQPHIPALVSIDQSGFIRGRNITDNFAYAAELVQCCYKRRVPTIVLKLDFRKAFDSVDWSALDCILHARGFGDKWCSWIRAILETGRTAVLLNGVPGRWFDCKQGLRQGDPLSPYLFIIVADVLQQLITGDVEPDRLRHPLVDDLPCPVIQYADDTLLLLRATPDQLLRAKTLLDTFSRATGLEINFQKSAFVPICVPEGRADELAALVGCAPAEFPQTYLGLPLTARKLRVQDLQHLVVKVEKRAPGWKSSLLNLGSRLTLTDAVLSALPSFAMSVIPLPVTTIDRMNRPRRGMLWKGKAACSGGDCQVAWQDVCRSRAEGGLGVHDLRRQNTCLLLKFVHKLLRGDDTPWTRWVRRWYGANGIAEPPSSLDTPAWRSFKRIFAVYRGLTNVKVGNGATTSFWFDNWHAAGPLFARVPELLSQCTTRPSRWPRPSRITGLRFRCTRAFQ
jgi:exonuclease III